MIHMKYATFPIDSPPTLRFLLRLLYTYRVAVKDWRKNAIFCTFSFAITNITRIGNRRDSTHKSAPFYYMHHFFGTTNIQLLNCPAGYDVIGILANEKSSFSGEATAQPIK